MSTHKGIIIPILCLIILSGIHAYKLNRMRAQLEQVTYILGQQETINAGSIRLLEEYSVRLGELEESVQVFDENLIPVVLDHEVRLMHLEVPE